MKKVLPLLIVGFVLSSQANAFNFKKFKNWCKENPGKCCRAIHGENAWKEC